MNVVVVSLRCDFSWIDDNSALILFWAIMFPRHEQTHIITSTYYYGWYLSQCMVATLMNE